MRFEVLSMTHEVWSMASDAGDNDTDFRFATGLWSRQRNVRGRGKVRDVGLKPRWNHRPEMIRQGDGGDW